MKEKEMSTLKEALKNSIPTLMTQYPAHTKGLVGLKRLVDVAIKSG